ncbi:Alpha/Beta hydrolase protein [Cladochytrium replicatum]|nr:Alpha/Beta hydrolase protein [Cladochytrium replicatum]
MKAQSECFQYQVSGLLMKEVEELINAADGVTLEARIAKGTTNPDICVIVAHPYGPLGGSMYNNVVESVCELFSEFGFSTARFNFRGVGRSSGRTSFRGFAERDDVLAVYRHLMANESFKPTKIILCGYSYGSMCTSAVACEIPEAIAIIAISYPCAVSWFLTMWNTSAFVSGINACQNIPKLFVIGDSDTFSSVRSFETFVSGINDPKTTVVVPGVDHFWFGQEEVLVEEVRRWMSSINLSSGGRPERSKVSSL